MKTLFLLLFFALPAQQLRAESHADTSIIRQHLVYMTSTIGHRTFANLAALNKTAAYISNEFAKYADTVYTQPYKAKGFDYQNVICSFGPKDAPRMVIGAHYDVCDAQPGADDNASGVSGLLELARMLKGSKLKYRIDLVAYSLEEPPYFKTQYMGSYIHAKSLAESHAKVYGMISLEMIGYFKDAKNSQRYPLSILHYIYGSRGNYITLIRKFGAGTFARCFCSAFKHTHAIRTKKFTGPAALQGIDYSDHLNYWLFGFSALMITDTSFYRNANYHERSDSIETLDIGRMAKVIDGVYKTLIRMNS